MFRQRITFRLSIIADLRDHVQVGDESTLQNDRDVGGVEKLDGVARVLAPVPRGLYGQVHPEALEVDHHAEDEDGGSQVHQVGQVLSVEGLAQGAHLVLPGGEQVEEGDDGALELGAAAGVDGGGAERLPDDRLADVGRDEERDAAAQAIAFLKELVQQQHNQTSHKELQKGVLVKSPNREAKSALTSQESSLRTWMMINRQTPAPISLGSPYIPVSTYTIALKKLELTTFHKRIIHV